MGGTNLANRQEKAGRMMRGRMMRTDQHLSHHSAPYHSAFTLRRTALGDDRRETYPTGATSIG
ncbi:hypothetical protein Mal15_39280 [Stieleria maiorica]|uniref:Uncharacterized protein n=1 Tax=Stieleria maiorica TaxID=2795974 RepID=A0A5B9MF02_9BACT|nr:hypothetical protein Mal15_39280 [Stieleria maiorica]